MGKRTRACIVLGSGTRGWMQAAVVINTILTLLGHFALEAKRRNFDLPKCLVGSLSFVQIKFSCCATSVGSRT